MNQFCDGNTFFNNSVINNAVNGFYIYYDCDNNKIIKNTVGNDGTDRQDRGHTALPHPARENL